MSIQDRSITFVTEESVMTTQLLRRPSGLPSAEEFDAITSKEGRVYAIAFDMDIESLKSNYGDPYNNAYYEIRRVLQKHGFTWQQGSLYFGGEQINAVTCVLAAMDLARSLPWFAASVRDIRMLRIEELNDLMPAVQQAQP
jgi:virulence-associated protein VapD